MGQVCCSLMIQWVILHTQYITTSITVEPLREIALMRGKCRSILAAFYRHELTLIPTGMWINGWFPPHPDPQHIRLNNLIQKSLRYFEIANSSSRKYTPTAESFHWVGVFPSFAYSIVVTNVPSSRLWNMHWFYIIYITNSRRFRWLNKKNHQSRFYHIFRYFRKMIFR